MRSTPARAVAVLMNFVALGLTASAEEIDLTNLIEPVQKQHAAPGLLAAMVRDGKLAGWGAVGVRALGNGAAVERGDLFLIGSCGKALTRALVGRLMDQKKLRAESTLGELLPDVPMRDEYQSVTIAQLLAHRAGIQPYTEIGPGITPEIFSLNGAPAEQRAAFAAIVLGKEPVAKPGSRFEYSNAGYMLLGHVCERLAKAPFEALMEREVFGPVGMSHSFVGTPADRPGTPALQGHLRSEGQGEFRLPPRQRPGLAVMAPAGLMTSTIDDFAKMGAFLSACESGTPQSVLSPATAAAIREARPGAGGEGEIFFGGDGFYTAAFALWPSKKLAIVVGSNAGDCDAVCADAIGAIVAAHAPEVARDGAADAGGQKPRYGFMVEATDPDNMRITKVNEGSIAQKADLRAGDRVLEINGSALSELTADEVRARLRGTPLRLKVEREGKQIEVVLKL